MAYEIKNVRGFNPVSYFAHQATERLHLKFGASRKTERAFPFPNDIVLNSEQNCHGFSVKDVIFTDREGNHDLLILDLTPTTTFVEGAIKPNRDTFRIEPHVALPLGPVHGDYTRGYPQKTQYDFFTNSGKKDYGARDVVNRFVGAGPLLNRPFSGGLVIEDGKLQIGDQDQLKEAKKTGKPTMQLFYSFTDENGASLAQQRWTHFGKDQPIGSSSYTWSWYHQDENKTLFICPKRGFNFQNNMISFDSINAFNHRISLGNPWKSALADSGLGGGFVIRKTNQPTYASHPHPELFHTVPLLLIAKPQQS